VLAKDIAAATPGMRVVLDGTAYRFPATNWDLSGDFYAQALFDSNPDLRMQNAPGNLYSPVMKVTPAVPYQGDGKLSASLDFKLELSEQIPAEQLPADTPQLKFVKLRSQPLSKFYKRPIYLRAGIVLPHDYDREPGRRYPLWVRIGGFSTRYTAVTRMMAPDSGFAGTWQAAGTPQFIMLLLDGAGPFGDPYYINSANNGPYGDALVHELIPYVEEHFRAIGQSHARVLSGVSTGGWVCLALQIFYPDFFNGAWSSCPDPVDFRLLERINIYSDENAYVDVAGQEQPSERNREGRVTLTVRREVAIENLLGRGNSYACSGQQWGAWNAAFSPRGDDGLPAPIWDPQTGRINHKVAEQWRQFDLREFLERNKKRLAPKLSGKVHIASGEADDFYLNEAMHLMDESLGATKPPWNFDIAYGPGKRHGWSNLTLRQMLEEMEKAVRE
jgi:S-formylglutathione hydrolase FrmB